MSLLNLPIKSSESSLFLMNSSSNIKNSISELTKRFHKAQENDLPYLVNSFLKHTNIIEVQEAEIDFDGYAIAIGDNKYIIGYNRNLYDHRRRFTCCHEIAHTLPLRVKLGKFIKDVW